MGPQSLSKDLHYTWPPPRSRPSLSVHVPASVISVEHGIFKKTLILGLVARAVSIFRVDRISVYMDPDASQQDLELAGKVLNYMASPPHLRRRLVKRDRMLRAAGLLPPLAVASHPTEEDLGRSHIRPALVVSRREDRLCIDPGVGRIFCLEERSRSHREGDVVFVKMSGRSPEGLADRSDLEGIYWGYSLDLRRSLRSSLEDDPGFLVISSREGRAPHEIRDALSLKILGGVTKISIVFGSPTRDPEEIAVAEGWDLARVENVKINTAPLQGVRSIRTYEALYITLAVINSMIYEVVTTGSPAPQDREGG